MDNPVLKRISELTGSYSLQAGLYRKLNDCVQKMYSRLVLSRGDLPQVMGMLEEKQRLINAISSERERVREIAELWSMEKTSIPESSETRRLKSVLEETETAIKEFLDIEQQLERYLSRLAVQEGGKQA
jgi:hypothetical protein